MRCIALILMAVALQWASAAQPTPKKPPARQHHSHSAQRNPGAWDPGYTLYNPFGLPPWLRRPPASPAMPRR